MDRKEFIRQCTFGCLGGAAAAFLLPGCVSSKMITGSIIGDDLVVPLTGFETKAGAEIHFKKYLVVQHDLLKYPVCVYRASAQEYTALLMRCTHQGAELQVFGDTLQCPAHG